nr:hypothetical protein [Oceanococcus sp. HetDA_MAG_MS8]
MQRQQLNDSRCGVIHRGEKLLAGYARQSPVEEELEIALGRASGDIAWKGARTGVSARNPYVSSFVTNPPT